MKHSFLSLFANAMLLIHDATSFAPSLFNKPSVSKRSSRGLNSVLTRPRPSTSAEVELVDEFPSTFPPPSSVSSSSTTILPTTTATGTFFADIEEKELSSRLQLLDQAPLNLPSLSELSQKVNRPTKKKVSLHSVLGTTAVGTSLLAILPHLAFSLKDSITCLNLGVDTAIHLPQLHLANLGLTLVMITGMLRLPKKAYKARTSIFQCIAAGMTCNFVHGLSNLMGPGSPYLIDAWSLPGRLLIGGTAIASSLGIANLYHDVITGPLKGRECNPLYENRHLGLISTTKYCLSFAFQIAIMMPMFAPKAKFDSFTAPLLQACGATVGTLTFGKFINNFYLAMGALCATFQFEKRASRRDCNLALGSIAFFSLWDIYKYLFQFVRAAVLQEAGPKLAFVKYLGTIEKSFGVMTLWFLPIVLAIVHGAITAAREKRYHLKAVDWCHPRRMPKIAGL